MSKTKKIWLGILTFLPLLFIVLYFFGFLFMFFGTIIMAESGGGEEVPWLFMGSFAAVFVFMMIAVVLSLGLLIYYIMHVLNNPKLQGNDQLMWLIIIIFANMIGYAIYWYVKIWKDEDQEPKIITNEDS